MDPSLCISETLLLGVVSKSLVDSCVVIVLVRIIDTIAARA